MPENIPIDLPQIQEPLEIPSIDPKLDLVPNDPSKVIMTKDGQDFEGPNNTESILKMRGLGFKFPSEDQENRLRQAKINEEESRIPENAIFPPLDESHEEDKIFGSNNTLRLLNPNGESFDVSAPDAIRLFNQGWKFEDPNAQIGLEAQLKHQEKGSDFLNKLDAVLQGGGTLGIEAAKGYDNLSDPNMNNVSRYSMLADAINKESKYKEYQAGGAALGQIVASEVLPIAGWAGKAGGFVESLAPEAIGLTKLGLKSASGALEGSINSIVPITVDAINGNSEAAKESLLLGAGLGAVLRPLSGAIGEYVKPEARAARALNAALLEHGIPQEEIDALPSNAKNILSEKLESSGSPAVAKTLLEKLSNGSAISELVPKLEKSAPDLELMTTDELGAKAESLVSTFGRDAEPAIDDILIKIEKAANNQNEVPLTALEKLSKSLLKGIPAESVDVEDSVKKTFSNMLQRDVLTLGDKAATASGDTKLISDWTNAKDITDLSKQLVPKLIGNAAEKSGTSFFAKFQKAFKNSALRYAAYSATAPVLAATGLHPGIAAGMVGADALAHVSIAATRRLMNSYIRSGITKSASTIKNAIENGAGGSILILDSIHSIRNKIAEIPNKIGRFESAAASAANSYNGIKETLGDEANGLSEHQQFERLSEYVATGSNPAILNEHLDNFILPFKDEHPKFAQDVKAAAMKKIQYINSITPKNPSAPIAFLPKQTWKPSNQQLYEYNKNLSVIQDPLRLIDEIHSGTVTKSQVDAVINTSPEIFKLMKVELAKEAANVHFNYQQRLAASRVMGEPLDHSIAQVQQLQSIYAPVQTAAAPQPPRRPGKGGSKLNPDKLPAAQPTLAEKLQDTNK